MLNSKKNAGERGLADRQKPQDTNLMSASVIAVLGFACYFGWELAGVFVSPSALISMLPIDEMTATRIPFLIALVTMLSIAFRKADWVFDRRSWVLPIWVSFSFVSIIISLIDTLLEGNIPLYVQMISSVAFGIGQAGFLLYWAVYFSLIPTRYTPIVIALSSCLGTLFYILASNLASRVLSLGFNALMVLCSLLVGMYLMKSIPSENIIPTKKFNKLSSFTFTSSLSVGTHSIAYGFTTITLFTLGPTATAIGCSTGIVGTLFCFFWYKYGSKTDVNTSLLQRVTLPFIVIALLMLPYVEESGKLICCCLLNVALSHFIIMSWINTTTANSEFQLHPISCSALSRIPGWIGFLVGVMYAYCIYFAFALTGSASEIATIIIVVVVTSASAIYGMDDSQLKERFSVILTGQKSDRSDEDEPKPSRYYKEACQEVIELYNLSPREADVFQYLAKGRNAEYISEQLVVSGSTVKTHIYHIYQKMGINSQQRLMDVVEEKQHS